MNKNSATFARLAKNTIYMYIRMAVLMVVALYTSRVILQQLGVEDYGIYSVVGSVVAFFSSLRGMFSSATQRFLNYESGRGNTSRMKDVFSTSVFIHLCVAILFCILSESIGIWFLEYKANIAPERIVAAHYVLQFSIVSAVITIMTIPYDAVIISREKMGVYAYMSIAEALLKLLSAYILIIAKTDKLILYGVLQLLIAVIMRIANGVYCKHKFEESHFSFCWDKSLMKEMFSIAGWNFFGNTSFAITNNGLNMVLNVFGGPVVNAARNIAYQVSGVLTQFVSNIAVVINPHSVKSYAAGDMKRVSDVFFFSSKVFFIIQLVLVVIVVFLTQPLLQLWLGEVPEYTVSFVHLVMYHSLVRAFHSPINTLFLASGKMRTYQITEGIVLAMPLLATYIGLKSGAPYSFAFVSMIFFELVNLCLIVALVHKVTSISITKYFINVILPSLICFGVASLFYVLNEGLKSEFWYSAICAMVCICTILLLMFFMGMSKNERYHIYKLLKIVK